MLRTSTFLTVQLAFLSFLSAADNSPPPGFTALFNGRDFSGWQGGLAFNKLNSASTDELSKAQAAANELMRAHWKVEAGVLINDGKGTNLATIKQFGNFELMVDWKINPKGDSGIYLRGQPQVQIWDSKSLSDRFAREKNQGSGALWNNKNPDHKLPITFADNDPGEWNTFHIIMVGDKVTVRLNGKLVVDQVPIDNYFDKGQPAPARGPIELQYHPNQDGKPDNLYFKNVYLKELP